MIIQKQVSRRGGISGASPSKKDDNDDQEIAALAAITGAIIEEVKKSKIKNKQSIIQIVIYESSVWTRGCRWKVSNHKIILISEMPNKILISSKMYIISTHY